MHKIPKSYLSPNMLRMFEMLERIDKLYPVSTTSQKIDKIKALDLKIPLSVSALRYQQKGISGMFKKASFSEKMLGMFSYGLHERIKEILSKLEADIYIEEVNEVDFFPEQSTGSKIILKEVPLVEKLIGEIYIDNHKLYQVSPSDFEEMMAEYLRKEGWEVSLSKKTRDGGYDMIALQHIGSLPFKVIAECKRFAPKRKVGIDILRGFQTVMLREKANKGVIFTSSYFSTEVRKEKDIYLHHQIDLKDYDDIMSWINAKKNG